MSSHGHVENRPSRASLAARRAERRVSTAGGAGERYVRHGEGLSDRPLDLWDAEGGCVSGDASVPQFAKAAFGLRDWARQSCVGEWAFPRARVSDASEAHCDCIEGQAPLFNPSYAGVSLGFLRGSQPDALVLCHQVGRTQVIGLPDFPPPSLTEAIERHLVLARRTNRDARFVGVCLDTSMLTLERAKRELQRARDETGLVAADRMRLEIGVGPIIEACLEGART